MTTGKGSTYQDNNSQEEENQERLHKYEYSGLDRTYRMNPSIENNNATQTKHVK